MSQQITLYASKPCPFAHRVEIALAEAKVEYTRFEIDLRNKPEWYALKINPVGKVPAIAYGGPTTPAYQPSPESTKLVESLVLVEFVADLFPESGILPKDPVLRAKVRLFIDVVVNKIAPALLSVIFRGEDPEELVKAYEAIQALLPPQGFAIGEFSAADIAVGPFLARNELYLSHDLGGYPAGQGLGTQILELLRAPKLARLQQYYKDIQARPSFASTYDKELVLPSARKRFADIRAAKYGA